MFTRPARVGVLGLVLATIATSTWGHARQATPALHSANEPQRTVAVTFDDLPGFGIGGLPMLEMTTTRLLGHIRAAGIPATAFANEQKLSTPGEEAQRTALLRRWVDAGMELGNHTYSHPSLYVTPLSVYQADGLRGERVTKRLLAKRGARLRYFRHHSSIPAPI